VPPNGPTGSLLDGFLGLFEGKAYAQTTGGSPAAFAHHTHLNWALPTFAEYPTAVTFWPGVVGPYAFSPVWKAPPFAQLTTVDVFSATSTTDRQLVREYQLQYTPNRTETRTYLTSIQVVGDCDSVGGISESQMPGALASCAASEAFPPTTFTYYGIDANVDTDYAADGPNILSETAAYTPRAAAAFMADLNGDAIDDLVCGLNGAGAVTQCLDKYEQDGLYKLCPINGFEQALNAYTWGIYNPKIPCNCPIGAQVTGPAQDNGHTFSTTTNGSLTSYTADDSMWAFSVYADWAATGRTSFLQVLPPLPLQPQLFSGGYTNTAPQLIRLSQLSDPSNSHTTLQDLSGQLQNNDEYQLSNQMNMTGPAYCAYGSTECNNTSVGPYNAMDVDGDGLPDMAGLNWGPNNAPQIGGFWPNTTMLSTRDRNGVTHPFQQQMQHAWSRWELPGWSWNQPGWGGSWGDFISGGTYFGVWTTGSCCPYDQHVMFTSAVHAGADIDGDGLADKITANKFRDDWNQTMYQTIRGNIHDYKDQGAFDGQLNRVGLVVLPNRGNGRFGVPSSYVSSPDLASGTDWGNYVTPGAVAPFSPYTYVGNFDGKPPYSEAGPAPLPQSDDLSPGDQYGWSMQGSVIRFGDLNGDGMADYATLDPFGVHICLRYGAPWDAAHWRCTTEKTYTGDNQSILTNAHANIMIADVNGSGINRVIYFPAPSAPLGTPGQATAILVSPDGSSTNSSTSKARDGLLQTVSNGQGGQTTYTYATVNSLGIGTIPVPAWVVTSETTTNGLGAAQAVQKTTTYSYETPIYDARSEMFVGFRSVTSTTSAVGGASRGLRTKTTFTTQTDSTCAGIICAGVAEAMIHASRFQPAVVETSEIVDGAVRRRFSTTVYSYAYQSAYTALDSPIPAGTAGLSEAPARPGMTLAQRTTLVYPWNAGDAGVSQFIAPTITFTNPPNAEGQLGVDAAFVFPSGGNVIKHQSFFDITTGNETLTQDFGVAVAGYDTPIITKSSWVLPLGDTTGWDYRLQQSTTGYAADSTATTIDVSKPYRELDYIYDNAGRVLTVSSPLSGAVPLPGPSGGAFAAGQPPTAETNGALITLQRFQYDPQFGNVTQIGNQDYPCVRTVGYDPLFSQLPETVTDFPNGCGNPGRLVTNLTYDRRLDVEKSSMDPSGALTLHSYDDFGRIAEIDKPAIDMPGATTKMLTAQYTDSEVIALHQVHYRTALGQDNSTQTATGYLDHYVYIDGLGQTLATMDQVDPSAYVDANFNSGVQWVISGVHTNYANGRVATTYRPFAASGPAAIGAVPAEITTPQGASASQVYDGLGRVTQSTDYLGLASTATYYDADLETVYVDPQQATDGSYKAVTKDGHGRVISQDAHLTRAPTGSTGTMTTRTAYQATGEVVSIQQLFPGGSSLRTMVYDSIGRMVQNTEPNVGTWTYAYDAEGHLVGSADARGCGQNMFYDALGRILARDYSPCTDTQATYSAISGVGGATFPYPGAEASYSYDSAGRLLAVADRARSDSYSYHSDGHIKQVARELAGPPNGGPPVYGPPHMKSFDVYTVDGRPMHTTLTSSALANPPGTAVTETATYTMDGQLSQVASSLSGTVVSRQIFYPDRKPYLTTYGDAAATEAGAGYDANGTLSAYAILRPNPGPWVTTYAPGQAPAATDPSVIQVLTYTAFTRDNVGNPTYINDYATSGWPAGAQALSVQASYYSDYRLRQASTNPTDSYLDPYAYEASIGSTEYPYQTTPSTNARWEALGLSYDWRGNVTMSGDDATDFFDRSLGTVASSADRLTSATGANGETLLTQYDAAGNLTQIDATSTEYNYEWDEVGNLAYASRFLGTVGCVGRMCRERWLSEAYQYTDDGQRVIASSEVAGGFLVLPSTYTVNIFDSQVLKNAYYDYTAGDYVDDLTTEQVYIGDGLARVFSDSTSAMPQVAGSKYASPSIHTFLNLRAHNGSGAYVIDQDTSELVERTAYMPYGAVDTDWRNSRWQGSREDLKYTGHWDDAEVGLIYMGARYYSPQLGRFISPDPLTIHGVQGDLNPYEYAFGNPLLWIDPFGLDDVTDQEEHPQKGPQACTGASGAGTTCPDTPPPPPPAAGQAGTASDPYLQCTPGNNCQMTCDQSGCYTVTTSGGNNPGDPPPIPTGAPTPTSSTDSSEDSSGTGASSGSGDRSDWYPRSKWVEDDDKINWGSSLDTSKHKPGKWFYPSSSISGTFLFLNVSGDRSLSLTLIPGFSASASGCLSVYCPASRSAGTFEYNQPGTPLGIQLKGINTLCLKFSIGSGAGRALGVPINVKIPMEGYKLGD
jgi:RHS repeat-associated protein